MMCQFFNVLDNDHIYLCFVSVLLSMELQEAFARELELFQTLSQDCLRRVLVFPCINSYSRLKLHEITKEKFAELTSFSGMYIPMYVPFSISAI